jgi:hypothetical protein
MSFKEASSKNPKNDYHSEPAFSVCPSGEEFPLPKDEDYASEFHAGRAGRVGPQ